MLAFGAAGAAAAGLFGLRGRDASLQRVQGSGVLRVGCAVEAPYVTVGPDGQVDGESPAVARAVAHALGVTARWVLTEFDSLLPQLLAGRYDIVAAGLFVTPERARRVAFTQPTLQVRPGWLTIAGNPKGLHSYREPPPGGRVRVAVLADSVEQTVLAAHWPAHALLTVPDAASGRSAVVQGTVDALALSLPSVRVMATASDVALQAIEAINPGARVDHTALALRPADRALRGAVDEALNAYVGSRDHLQALAGFGFGRADLPEGARDGT